MIKKVEEFDKGIFEEEIQRIKIKKRKRYEVKFRGGRVQEKEVARKIYNKVVIWMG